MRLLVPVTFVIIFIAHIRVCSYAALPQQDSLTVMAGKFTRKVLTKTSKIDHKLQHETNRTLQRLQQQELRLRERLMSIDSLAAKRILGDLETRYSNLQKSLEDPPAIKSYIPQLDSLSTSLKFLRAQPIIDKHADQINHSIASISGLENKFQQSDKISAFIKERQGYLQDQLANFGVTKQLLGLKKEMYYYRQQVQAYKGMLNDRKKMEEKMLGLLRQSSLFQDFMKKNGMLAAMFGSTGNNNNISSEANFTGLQTRNTLNDLMQQAMGSGPNAGTVIQQNMQAGQAQLGALKSRIMAAGGGSSEVEMPNFKPNQQKTKTFLQRLEYSTNLQTQKDNGWFPLTSDLSANVGYKINDGSVIGLGSSYKIGWGQGIRQISITSEGAGLRSFLEWKIKGSFWMAGGYEMNFRSSIKDIAQLQSHSSWQQSGLLGINKLIPLNKGMMKKMKLQALWDFLSYQQIPRTQSFIIRTGYSF